MPGIKIKRNYNASGASRAFREQPDENNNGLICPPTTVDKQNLFLRRFEVAKVHEVGIPAAHDNVPGTWLDFIEKDSPS